METTSVKKPSFEWVVSCGGREFYLTEAQYAYLTSHEEARFVTLGDLMINPVMVSWALRRPAVEIKKKFPCLKCNTNGIIVTAKRLDDGNFPVCPDCKGTGISLK